MKKCTPKIIGLQVPKKSIPLIKKELKLQGYEGISAVKMGKYWDVFYTKFKGKCKR